MRVAGRLLTALFVCGLVSPVLAQDPSAEAILKEIREMKAPAFAQKPGEDRQKAIDAYMAEMEKANAKRLELIAALQKADPENKELIKLLPQRWMILARQDKMTEAMAEIDHALATTKDTGLKTEGLYLKAQLVAMKNQADPTAAMPVVEEFLKLAPKDRRAPNLLAILWRSTEDEAKKGVLEDRILKDYPDSSTASMILGARKQKAAIGKPFELEFTDAIKETQVSMKGLKGKVVVIDFWATWCGPCIAEIPNMKRIYAEYKDKGVEFIGVSLDQPKEQGGLDALKEYVAKNEVQWPQYYQGNYWNSEFSKGWGINAIPAVFIVDADGNLYSVEARGKLETLIPELLKKAKTTPGAGE